jgi:hypothetical protein
MLEKKEEDNERHSDEDEETESTRSSLSESHEFGFRDTGDENQVSGKPNPVRDGERSSKDWRSSPSGAGAGAAKSCGSCHQAKTAIQWLARVAQLSKA